MRQIKKIIIHCSDSTWGNAEAINRWHKQRGFDECGYHYIILNGCIDKVKYRPENDGVIEKGRDIEKVGSHCKGENSDSIGICLIGKHHFTAKQLTTSLPFLLRELMEDYELTKDDVYAHHDFNKKKTCPNFEISLIKGIL